MLCRGEGSLRLVRRCCAESGALKLLFSSGREVENYEKFKENAPVDLQNVQNDQKVSRRLPKGGQKGANGSQREPKGSQREPKGIQREPKGGQKGANGRQKGAKREPTGAKREPKVSQGATKIHQKVDLWKRSRKLWIFDDSWDAFWSHFGRRFPSKIDELIDAIIDAEKKNMIFMKFRHEKRIKCWCVPKFMLVKKRV